MELNISANGV